MVREETFVFSSAHKDSGSTGPGNCRISLPKIHKIPEGTHAELLYFSSPNWAYTVRSGINDSLVISCTGGATGATYTERDLTLTAGIYDLDGLLTHMDAVIGTLCTGAGFTAAYSTGSYLVSYSSTGAAFKIMFHKESTCLKLIGFDKADTTIAASVIASQPADLSTPHMYFIAIPQLGAPMTFNTYTGQAAHFISPLEVASYGEYGTYKPNSAFRMLQLIYCEGTQTSSFDFRITDEEGYAINSDWTIVIKFIYPAVQY